MAQPVEDEFGRPSVPLLCAEDRLAEIAVDNALDVALKTGDVKATADTKFVISTAGDKSGSIWFNLVSLFPPTYKDQPNGFRIDLMEKLAELKPSFLRFP